MNDILWLMLFSRIQLGIFSFFIAIFSLSFLDVSISTELILLLFFLAALCLLFNEKKVFSVAALIFFSLAAGFFRFQHLSFSERADHLDYFVEEKHELVIKGYIAERPVRKEKSLDYVFQAEEILLDIDVSIDIDARVLVKSDPYVYYDFEDELLVRGVLKKPEAFLTEQNRIFEYDKYLYKDDIYYTMSFAQVEQIGERDVSRVKSSLYSIKDRLIAHIQKGIPRPASGLLSGVLFGEKAALDQETLEDFRRVGLMHIVVLSGYNVAIVIYAIMYLLRFLPLSVRSTLSVLGILAFMLLTGAGPTVVRASLMGFFIILSKLVGEKYDIRKGLLLAAFVMVCINPKILFFDISFQLSFLATYGLISFAPYFERKLSFVPNFLLLRESLVTSLAAQITVLPFLLYAIGEFSLISLLVNMIVLFAVPIAMLFGFIYSVLASFGLAISFLSFITNMVLQYILFIVDVFSQFSFSVIQVPVFSWQGMLALYILIFYWSFSLSRNKVL